MALFNGVRYWYAHEAWETLWRAAPDEDRDFYQGLIQIAAGLLHLQRRNMRGARNKLREGLEKLRRYEPAYHGIFVNELIGEASRVLQDLDARLPSLPHSAGHPVHGDRHARLQPVSEDRVERDTMGEVRVPSDAKWGPQTQRAVENFPISGSRLERSQIEALARIKGSAVASVKREPRTDRT